MTKFCESTYGKITKIMVGYSAYFEVISKLHEFYRLAEEHQRPEGMMILGPSGIGKTSVLTRFAEEFPARREETHMVRPVVMITMPAKPTEKALLYQLALAFGEQYATGHTYQLQNRVIWLLKKCQTRVVILDEAQHMVRRHSARDAALAGDTLKVIMDQAKVAMILGGIPEVEEILMVDEQIRGRFTYVQSLKPWKVVEDTKEDLEDEKLDDAQKELVGFLVALVKSSGYSGDYSVFENSDVVRRIYFATEGRIRYVSRLVAATMALVIPERAEVVTVEHLRVAFLTKIYNRAPDEANPFDVTFEERHLINKGEPFGGNPAWH